MSPSPLTRVSLIARLKDAGDHQAWQEFTAIYEPLLWRLLRSRGLQAADAQDACQQVLLAVAKDVERFVAVKVMAPHLAVSGSARQRFIREARAAAAIVHPNVMPIHAVNAEAKLPLLVMPYVDCESLQQRLDKSGPLGLAEILRIGAQAAAALAAAHAQGLVHRDVKPANILLEKGVDRVLLTDFGLARAVDDASLTRTGIIAGTPQFMSPEQARGEPVDARSDLFSLGSVLYVMGTGRPPFRAETSYGVLRRITDNEPRSMREINPQIPEGLAIVLNHTDVTPQPGTTTKSRAIVLRGEDTPLVITITLSGEKPPLPSPEDPVQPKP